MPTLAGCTLVMAVLSLLALPSPVWAVEPTGYGELTRFGQKSGEEFAGHLAPEWLRSRAIGVDPTDNSVYLLDEPKEPGTKIGRAHV